MRTQALFLFSAFVAAVSLSACATTRNGDLEERIIAAYTEQCKSMEYKWKDRELYVVDPTRNTSERGCPTALIRHWRAGVLIEEKEVETCECRGRHKR